MNKKRVEISFDYEEARLDMIDNGMDPDYLETRDPEKRDKYLRSHGMNPDSYKEFRNVPVREDREQKREERRKEEKKSWWSRLFESKTESRQEDSSVSSYGSYESEDSEPDELVSGSSYVGSTMIGFNEVDADDMQALSDAGYDESDLDLMDSSELREAMEDAGVDTDFYDFDF